MTNPKKTKENPCEKYELAITNYVMGEVIKIPESELFSHLAGCLSCQADMRNWRASYATMRAREYDARPGVRQKMKAFIKGLVYQNKTAGKTPIDTKWEIGSAAGKIYDLLKTNGEMSIPRLMQKTGLKEYHIQQAIGWLAREEKVALSRDGQTAYAQLPSGA